jgi:hypothetical protein
VCFLPPLVVDGSGRDQASEVSPLVVDELHWRMALAGLPRP